MMTQRTEPKLEDLTEQFLNNTQIPFSQSEIVANLFIHWNGKKFIYVDDCLYLGLLNKLEETFPTEMSSRFKLETQDGLIGSWIQDYIGGRWKPCP